MTRPSQRGGFRHRGEGNRTESRTKREKDELEHVVARGAVNWNA